MLSVSSQTRFECYHSRSYAEAMRRNIIAQNPLPNPNCPKVKSWYEHAGMEGENKKEAGAIEGVITEKKESKTTKSYRSHVKRKPP